MPVDTLTERQASFIDKHLFGLHETFVSAGELSPDESRQRDLTAAEGAARGNAVRKMVVSRLQRVSPDLKTALAAYVTKVAQEFPQVDAAGLGKAIASKLSALISKMASALNESIERSARAGDPDFAATVAAISRLKDDISKDGLVAALRDNSMMDGRGIEAAFLSALDDIERALST